MEKGSWRISSDGERFSLESQEAALSSVLEAVQELVSIEIRVRDFEDHPVSIRMDDVPLDRLLERLGLSYVLTYRREGGGEDYQLETGWVAFFPPAPGADAGRAVTSPFHPSRTAQAGEPDKSEAWPAPVVEALKAGVNGEEYRAAFPVSITVDGAVVDWPEGAPVHTVASRGPDGSTVSTNRDKDASFAMKGVADDDYLYLALHVSDDLRATNNLAALRSLPDDTLEVRLSSSDEGAEPVRITIQRHHVFASATPGGVLEVAPRQFVSFSEGTRAVIVDGPEGWTVEMAVPLERLGPSTPSQTRYGFDVVLTDRDSGEDSAARISWRSAGRVVRTPGDELGALRLWDVRPAAP